LVYNSIVKCIWYAVIDIKAPNGAFTIQPSGCIYLLKIKINLYLDTIDIEGKTDTKSSDLDYSVWDML